MNCMLSRFLFSALIPDLIGDARQRFVLSRELVEEAVRAVCCGSAPPEAACSATCVWSRGFRQEISADPEIVRRHQKPGNPFVLDFPSISKERDSLSIGLTLIGSAIQDAEVYIKAIGRLCRGIASGGAVAVDSVDLHDALHSLGTPEMFHGDRLLLISLQDVLDAVPSTRKALLQFHTPLRLFHGGRPVPGFDFPLFFRSLLRRVSSLVAYYCDVELDIDFRAVSRVAGEIACCSSGLSTVSGRGIGGFVGEVLIEGDLQDLLPILRAGELLHAGKGASYGYGSFKLDFPD